LSFHKYGDFFPGTGHIKDTGAKEGIGFSVNVPLNSGMCDDSYQRIFQPILDKIMEVYQPGAIVLQCGADSLTGDRLGCFNLSLKGHAQCVEYVKSFGIPTLLLGGGGYTIRNVARCWAYETSVVLDCDIPNQIPFNDYYEYYAPDFELHLNPEPRDNLNTDASLDGIQVEILQQLQSLQGVPSVQMQQVPPEFNLLKDSTSSEGINDGGEDDDIRFSDNNNKAGVDRKLHESEFYDNDKDTTDIPQHSV